MGALLLGGCLAPSGTQAPGAPASPAAAASASPLDLQAEGCDEGGSYVTWNAFDGDRNFPAPFEPVDVSDDVGRPPTTSLGGSAEDLHAADTLPGSTVTGAYHALIHCATWTFGGVAKEGLWFAFVGARIAPPPFDPAPVAREYLALLGVQDPDLAAALRGAGFAVENLSGLALGFEARTLHQALKFDHHGDIVAKIPLKAAGSKPSETTRLWTLAPVDDTHVRPLALDFTDRGGERFVASAPGFFEHTTPSAMEPAPGTPLHTFTSWALAYRGVTRTLGAGPAADLLLESGEHHERRWVGDPGDPIG